MHSKCGLVQWALLLLNYKMASIVDPSLLKEREAFKKRSHATPVVEKKVSKAKVTTSSGPLSSKAKPKKKKQSHFSRPKPSVLHTGKYDKILRQRQLFYFMLLLFFLPLRH